jgi:hypothetical protein
MDKSQGLQSFWETFGIPAYDELTVPDNAVMPYITYSNVTDSLGSPVPLTGSIWYHSTSWEEITKKADQISEYVNVLGFALVKLDNGYIYITKGNPFAQRMSDDSDSMIRRIYINLMAEYLTQF